MQKGWAFWCSRTEQNEKYGEDKTKDVAGKTWKF